MHETFRHPELHEGEMWLTNTNLAIQMDHGIASDYRTKRYGKTAYDTKGDVVPGMFPIFVKVWEWEEKTGKNAPKVYS